jgi:hypothetical protein
VVEAQNRFSTMKLADSRESQAVLEDIIEQTKPKIPEECRRLHYLLYTPFRYDAPYPYGSRFRKVGFTPGVFYGSAAPFTAIAEMAFHRLLFFAESPGTPFPANASEYTALMVPLATRRSFDLTRTPLNRHAGLWLRLADYVPCQDFAEAARETNAEVIQYASVRDPDKGRNFAVLACSAFAALAPAQLQTWWIQLRAGSVWARCEAPQMAVSFDWNLFLEDPRLAPLKL